MSCFLGNILGMSEGIRYWHGGETMVGWWDLQCGVDDTPGRRWVSFCSSQPLWLSSPIFLQLHHHESSITHLYPQASIILHTCVNFSFWYFRLIAEQCIIHVAGAVNAFSFVETACLRKSSYNKVWCAPITGRWRNVLEIDQSSSSERAPRSFLSGCRLFLDSSRQLEITKNNFATFTFYQKIKAHTNRPLKNFQTFHFHCFRWKVY